MQKYCLETTFLVDFLRGKKEAIEMYRRIRKYKLETTSITAWEILRGPKIIGREEEYKTAVRLLGRLKVLPFTMTSARIAADIEVEQRKKGREISIVDILIAAVAIENKSKLVTRDKIYKYINGLEVELY